MNLLNEFESRISILEKKFDDAPFENLDFYCRWMNQHYYLVQHSTRFLTLCASKVDVNNDSDFKWWTHHLKEEMGHNNVLLKDLKSLNHDLSEEPISEVRVMIASQYYEIESLGPDALLGYALLLEGLSCRVCDRLAQKIDDQLKNKNATRFLKLHGKVDQGHYKEGLDRIQSFSDHRKKIILNNLSASFDMYTHFLKKIEHLTKNIQIAA